MKEQATMSSGAQEATLNGASAIVTGGAKGIGLGIAQLLARQGCHVTLWDLDEAALAAATRDHPLLNGKNVSVTSAEQVNQSVQELVRERGRIDILVNNAGIGGDGLITKTELESWERVISTNLTSQFLCCKAVAPYMIAQRHGRIVNLSSRAWLGNRGQASYSASKGGVVSLTRSLALEFARHGITVNAIAPGVIDTPLFGTLKPEIRDQLAQSVPMQRVGLPEDVANAVRFFVDPASAYVTGQLLYVCGGRSLGSPSV
jgi:3-oxoacyl-[acyl-carrier protein] reductase